MEQFTAERTVSDALRKTRKALFVASNHRYLVYLWTQTPLVAPNGMNLLSCIPPGVSSSAIFHFKSFSAVRQRAEVRAQQHQ